MRPVTSTTAAVNFLLCAFAAFAWGAEPNYGEREFRTRCAMCHGTSGRGDGWLAAQLIHRPPALTQLKKNNGGTFPRETVARIIDGRTTVKTHGPSEMPVWGVIYRSEMDAAAGARRGVREEDEYIISYRVQALVAYLATIQE